MSCHYLRYPRTTQEARYSCDEDHKPYVRAKRRRRNLPNAYDDKPRCYQKTWKEKGKRKTQYSGKKRLHKVELFFERREDMRGTLSMLRKKNISYSIKYVQQIVPCERIIEKGIVIVHKMITVPHYTNGVLTSYTKYKKPFSKLVTLDKPIVRKYNRRTITQYKLVYWIYE